MGIVANSGPNITYGVTVSASGAVAGYNESRGPSLSDLGDGMLDPRSQYNYGYQPGGAVDTKAYGFYGLQGIIDFIQAPL